MLLLTRHSLVNQYSISLEEVIRCNKIDIDNGNQIEYECSGSPVDCVKLAINKILSRQPDLIVSELIMDLIQRLMYCTLAQWLPQLKGHY